MKQPFELDDASVLARRIAERVAPLCRNVPASEVEQLASRLARLEVAAHAPGRLDVVGPVCAPVAGNQIAWLPGSAAAVVLPAGEEPPSHLPSAAELRALALRHAGTARVLHTRGIAVFRQRWSSLVSAYHARLGTELSDR